MSNTPASAFDFEKLKELNAKINQPASAAVPAEPEVTEEKPAAEEKKDFVPSFPFDFGEFVTKGYTVKFVDRQYVKYAIRTLTGAELTYIYDKLNTFVFNKVSQAVYDATMELYTVGACLMMLGDTALPMLSEYKDTKDAPALTSFMEDRYKYAAKLNITLADTINQDYVELYSELRKILKEPVKLVKNS